MQEELKEAFKSKLNGMEPGDTFKHPKTGEDWEYKGGKGVWAEFVNTKTGESTIKEYQPRKISQYDECDEHYFVLVDDANVRCKKCGFGQKIVWGKQIIDEGEIKNLTPQGQ